MSVHTIWNKVMSSKLGQAGAALKYETLTTYQYHYSPNKLIGMYRTLGV